MERIKVVEVGGIKMTLRPADLDQDGSVGGREEIQQKLPDSDIIKTKESSELGDVMEKAFEDKINPETKTSSMDMLANIKSVEEVYIFVINSLVSLDFYPPDILRATRQKLRLSVARDARGRNDIRDISIGKKQMDASLANKGMNFVGMNRDK